MLKPVELSLAWEIPVDAAGRRFLAALGKMSASAPHGRLAERCRYLLSRAQALPRQAGAYYSVLEALRSIANRDPLASTRMSREFLVDLIALLGPILGESWRPANGPAIDAISDPEPLPDGDEDAERMEPESVLLFARDRDLDEESLSRARETRRGSGKAVAVRWAAADAMPLARAVSAIEELGMALAGTAVDLRSGGTIPVPLGLLLRETAMSRRSGSDLRLFIVPPGSGDPPPLLPATARFAGIDEDGRRVAELSWAGGRVLARSRPILEWALSPSGISSGRETLETVWYFG